MKPISLKKEIGNILSQAVIYGTIKDDWGNPVTTYRAQGEGNRFYTIGVRRGETVEEVITAMEKKAASMFRKPSERINGGLERQKLMAKLIQYSHLLQDIADIRYQHLANGYSMEKAMRLVFDYKKNLPVEVTKLTRHRGRGEFINVYSVPVIDLSAAIEVLPLLPPKYLKGIELGC